MQTQQLQQNMKEKVKVFEDGGIRLLKKGQKGLVHAIFSRFGLVLVLLLLQFGALFSLLRWFGQLLPHYLGGTALVTAAMVVYLLNIDMDNSVRITWLVVIAVLPVLGVPLFWYTKADIGHNALKKRLMDLESQTRAQLPQPEGVEQRLEADSPGAASLARYLRGRGGGFPVYGNTAVTYFNGGEAKFAELLRQLETAEHYIFLEYFIIDEGLMWGRILEVLERYNINVDYLPSGIDSVSLVVETGKSSPYLYQAMGDLEKEIKPDSLHLTDGMAIVAAVGRKMAFQPGSSGKIFGKLGENGINIRMITQGPEELNIIVGVDGADFEKAIRALYDSFVK